MRFRHDPVKLLLEFLTLTSLLLALTGVVLILYAVVHPLPAGAQTPTEGPGDVFTAIQQHPDQAPCLLVIGRAESQLQPYAVNPQSGTYGPFQFLPHGGVWDVTPLGRQGIPVAATSVYQQTEMAAWALSHGHGSAWVTAPSWCR